MLYLCLDLTILEVRWPLLFFSETDFIYNYLHIIQKWRKNQCGKLKKFQDFCPRDMESCHLAAAKCVKLRSLITNLFFGEPHQLTEFTKYVHLNHIWRRTFPFKALIAIFWDLQPLWPSSLTKPDLLRFRCFSGHVLQNEVGDPLFFNISAQLVYYIIHFVPSFPTGFSSEYVIMSDHIFTAESGRRQEMRIM